MRTAALLREARLIESELNALEFQEALIEAMNNHVVARMIMSEQRKITRYALQIGLIEEQSLNEGFLADITLGLGQAIGSLPGLAQLGVGAAFGVAGVLWYGKEMLNSSGFDFAMNLIFCLLSAAAIEPTGVFGEAGALGKLIKPFATLGEWARGLGGAAKAGAKASYAALSGTEKLVVKGAVKAEGPLTKGLAFVGEKIIPKVADIFKSIKSMVMKLPGSSMFGKIADLVIKGAGKAFQTVKDALMALIELGKNAFGIAGRKGVEVAAKVAPEQVGKLLSRVPEFTYTTAKGAAKQVTLGLSADGGLILKGLGASGKTGLITASELPNVIAQIARTAGNDAAKTALTAASKSARFPASVIKSIGSSIGADDAALATA